MDSDNKAYLDGLKAIMITGSPGMDVSDRLVATELCSSGCHNTQPCEARGKTLPAEGRYCCGSCSQVFPTICCLHQHLQVSHKSGGSYHYNHYLRTAFPKFDTCCQSTQTSHDIINKDLHISSLVEHNALHTISTSEEQNITKHKLDQDNTARHSNIFQKIETTVACNTENIIAGASKKKDKSNHNGKIIKVEDADCIQGYSDTADGGADDCDDADEAVETSPDTKCLKTTDNLTKELPSENGGSKNRKSKVENKPRKRKQLNPKSVKVETDNSKMCNSKFQKDLSKREKDKVKDTREESVSSKPLIDPMSDTNCICELCGTKFSFAKGLLRHEQLKHFNQMKYLCQYCDQRFMREYNLQKHIKCRHTVGRGKLYKQKYRAKKKADQETMETSMTQTPENSPVSTPHKCGVLTGKFSESGETKVGRTAGRKAERIKSKFANKKINLENKTEPVESKYESSDQTAGQVQGPPDGCDPDQEKMCTETGENVSPKTPHTCGICGHTMPRAKMEVHQRLHSGERPYICHVCGKGLISQTKLARHMLIHSDVKKHTCDTCGAGFQMKYKLRMHQHIHTGKKPYLCSICGAEFNHSSNLATHTRCVHLQIKPFACGTCGGRYAKKSQLDGHMLSHSAEKQFTCRYCGKCFKYYKGMKRHEKNHMEERKFSCVTCGARYSRQDNLDRHVAASHIQTGASFPCSTCKHVFKTESLLLQHERSHVKPQQYHCVLCGERYKVGNRYYTHMLAAHGVATAEARLMVSGEKPAHGVTVMQALGQTPGSQVDPNLPLRLDVETPGDVEKPVSDNASGGLNVTQMVTGIMDDNRAAITALTRAATENLRLHSEDVNEEEKLKVIVPPLNPMILLERNQAFGSLPGASNLLVSQAANDSSASVVMLAPVGQANLKQNPHVVNETIPISQQQTIANQLEQNLSLSGQEARSTTLGPLQIALTQESRSMVPGFGIQEARMTLESLARQHETVSVPLTLMRLSENMMDPPPDRQNLDTQQHTPATGNVAYRESRSLVPGFGIQEARMTLESHARQHETVSVPLTLMRLSENMMDPPPDRQNLDTQQHTPATGNVTYRVQNLY